MNTKGMKHKDIQRKILTSMSWWYALDIPDPSTAQVAAIAGYALSGTFNTYLSAAVTAGLIERGDGRVTLTEQGCKMAPGTNAPGTLSELHERILETLDGPQQRIISAMIRGWEKHGSDYTPTTAEIGEACDPPYAASGTLNTYLSGLVTRGLISRRGGRISATEVLMPPGLIEA